MLLVGSGGREHALACKFAASPLLGKLFLWPANPGMLGLGAALALPPAASHAELLGEARRLAVDLIVVGPEAPLSAGLIDAAQAAGFATFGPTQAAAQLEASKVFAKDIMRAAGVPTASYEVAHSLEECRLKALQQLQSKGGVVLKASGLAAGKGVFVCKAAADIEQALHHFYATDMRQAAAQVVVEELMVGRECSYFVMLGGSGAQHSLGFAVDHKRLLDGDLGPNTGGMGCYTPVPWLPAGAADQIDREVVQPVVRELARRHISYQGWLYVGLMWTASGPRVVEFNVRLGDPEAQVLALQDQSDWLALIAALVNPSRQALLDQPTVKTADHHATVGVVLASAGYPFAGDVVDQSLRLDLAQLAAGKDGVTIFAASVVPTTEVNLVSPGRGRVLCVVARDASFAAARTKAYEVVAAITQRWPGAQFRRDIGQGLA